MNVWVITVGEPLPVDRPSYRPYRSGLLVGELVRRGHRVCWWSSVFDHSAKVPRDVSGTSTEVTAKLRINWIRSPGYGRNVSLSRLYDHYLAGKDFAASAEREARPDIVLCSLPTLDLAAAAARYCTTHGVPLVVDVRDWWPDEFATAFHPWLRRVVALACWPFERMADEACRSATAITGITDAFVDWGVRHAARPRRSDDRAFHMGYQGRRPDDDTMQAAMLRWRQRGVSSDRERLTVCYLGNFSRKVELDTVIEAAKALGGGFRFLLCGSGETREDLLLRASDTNNVFLPGRLESAEVWAAMELSDIGIAPYRPTESFNASLSNKMVEYLAGGLPVVTSLCGSTLSRLIDEHSCGATYTYGDPASLAAVLRNLDEDRERLRKMGDSAMSLYSSAFRASVVYSEMSSYLERLAGFPKKTEEASEREPSHWRSHEASDQLRHS